MGGGNLTFPFAGRTIGNYPSPRKRRDKKLRRAGGNLETQRNMCYNTFDGIRAKTEMSRITMILETG